MPEADLFNFVPRIKMPTLLLGGEYDFGFPVDTSQRPLFILLGTPSEHKRHVVFENAGHVPPRIDVIRETLDWLDRYLGPVHQSPVKTSRVGRVGIPSHRRAGACEPTAATPPRVRRGLEARPHCISSSRVEGRAIFTDILDFCARVLAIHGGKGRFCEQCVLIPHTVLPAPLLVGPHAVGFFQRLLKADERARPVVGTVVGLGSCGRGEGRARLAGRRSVGLGACSARGGGA